MTPGTRRRGSSGSRLPGSGGLHQAALALAVSVVTVGATFGVTQAGLGWTAVALLGGWLALRRRDA
ncbi:hypothetical protein [Streptomyces sp. NPDC088789]|uniref:hypothetical protein n=1 Tax=Streptomyces sp. NPDC088789 TaxID=3365899 RepID=UPI0038207F68